MTQAQIDKKIIAMKREYDALKIKALKAQEIASKKNDEVKELYVLKRDAITLETEERKEKRSEARRLDEEEIKKRVKIRVRREVKEWEMQQTPTAQKLNLDYCRLVNQSFQNATRYVLRNDQSTLDEIKTRTNIEIRLKAPLREKGVT